MRKVNVDFSKAEYTIKINSWMSLLLPIIRRIMLYFDKPTINIFGFTIYTWGVLVESEDEVDEFIIHMVIKYKNWDYAYRCDYFKRKDGVE